MVVSAGYLLARRNLQPLFKHRPVDNERVEFTGLTAGRDVFRKRIKEVSIDYFTERFGAKEIGFYGDDDRDKTLPSAYAGLPTIAAGKASCRFPGKHLQSTPGGH
jgi:hypothetical protein